MLANKEYDGLKRQLKKKRSIVDAVREVLGPLESQLEDQEVILKAFESERDQKVRELKLLRDEVHFYRGQFFELEVLEKEKKLVRSFICSFLLHLSRLIYHFFYQALDGAIADVDELEAEVVNNLNDNKRQSKLISVLSAQRYRFFFCCCSKPF
jgi:hypothetical protein